MNMFVYIYICIQIKKYKLIHNIYMYVYIYIYKVYMINVYSFICLCGGAAAEPRRGTPRGSSGARLQDRIVELKCVSLKIVELN